MMRWEPQRDAGEEVLRNLPLEWRLITDDGVSAGFGLAADEFLAGQVGRGESLPTLRLYTYRSHCALVGRFQAVEVEVDREFCEAHGIAINRRPTGGGAILMGEDQLGIALTVPAWVAEKPYQRVRALLGQLALGIVEGLRELGIEAHFARKNDLEVGGRKIAGLGLYRDPQGGLLFHSSLLVDLDIPLMLRVLRTPFEKISDKAITSVAERVTTVRRELGREVSVGEVREHIAEGYRRAFSVRLIPDEFQPPELEAIRRLEEEKYQTAEWIYQKSLTPDVTGSASVKAPGGLVTVHLVVVGASIKAAFITGDFFVREGTLAELEGLFRWHGTSEESIARTVEEFFARAGQEMEGIGPEHVTQAVVQAVQAARRRQSRAQPQGCFVNP